MSENVPQEDCDECGFAVDPENSHQFESDAGYHVFCSYDCLMKFVGDLIKEGRD